MKKRLNDNAIEGSDADVQDEAIYAKKTPRMRFIITAAVLVAAIVLNVGVALIADADMWYIDATRPRYQSATTTVYSLSEECASLIERDAVSGIKKVNAERASRGEDAIKLKIVFCADKDRVEEDEQMRYVSFTARALEKKFRDYIEVEYINISKNPSAVQKYKTTSAATIYPTNVIVEFGSEYLVQNISSFYYQDSGSTAPWAYNGEQRLSAMILSLTQAESPICAITNNHGEELFDENASTPEIVTTFQALLELLKHQIVMVEQDELFSTIVIKKNPNRSEDEQIGEIDEYN